MEKKITISNTSKIASFFDEISKKKTATKKLLETKLIKAGVIPQPSEKVRNQSGEVHHKTWHWCRNKLQLVALSI